MGVVPIICLTVSDGKAVSTALQKSGVPAPLVPLDRSAEIPEGDAYVVVDGAGLPASRRLNQLGEAHPALSKAIAYAPAIPARDISALERLGIQYYCNSNNGLSHLFKLIGQIKADILLKGRARTAEAEATALSILNSTTSALDRFAERTAYDPGFHTELAASFTSKVRSTNLFLLLDAIQRDQNSTLQHCALVTTLASAFAFRLGFTPVDLERVFLSAFFHDIGKSAIPSDIVDKPGVLTEDERKLMQTHVTVGHALLRRFPETAGEIADVALSHHEYLDGSGYPHGLRAAEIPDMVRLVTVADIFAALIERRAYKAPMSSANAYSVLRDMGGKLDQDLVRLFQPVAEMAGALK